MLSIDYPFFELSIFAFIHPFWGRLLIQFALSELWRLGTSLEIAELEIF